MLSKKHYQEFIFVAEKMQKTLDLPSLEVTVFQADFAKLQQIWQEKILTLNTDEFHIANQSHYQSLQTEINRALHLLATEIMLLVAAKQESTRQSRLINCHNRLNNIIGYCQGVLKEIGDE